MFRALRGALQAGAVVGSAALGTVLLGATAMAGSSTIKGDSVGGGQDGELTAFVVDTQYVEAPSRIIAAFGPLEDCTTVREEHGTTAEPRGPGATRYTGRKILHCSGETVRIAYDVTFTDAIHQTQGTWRVIGSTLDGVRRGGGILVGDARSCIPDKAKDSPGCITDLFVGHVR